MGDTGERFGIADFLVGAAVDLVDSIHHQATLIATHSVGVFQIQDGVAFGAALHSLIDRGQESTTPSRLARGGILAARDQNHKPGKVLVLGAEAISDPGPKRSMSRLRVACVE